jgi:hypothetical protein
VTEPLDDDIKAAIKAFEDADDLFQLEPERIFGNDGQRKAALFALLARRWKSWEHTGACMYRGCGRKSIARSHSIHRAGPIEQIAEDQHVLTPSFGENGISLKRIGVREASTFPGFCETHEQLFIPFESTGRITDGRQAALQAFRTVCREIVRKRHDVEHVRRGLEAYRAARNNYFRDAIHSASPAVEFKGVSEEGNHMEDSSVSLLAEAEDDLSELDELYDELFQYIDSGMPEPCIYALDVSPDIFLEIPVALSGLGVMRYRDSKRHRALCLLGILPQGKTTLTFIAAARRHSKAITHYANQMQVGFGTLNAMESWMVYGSDHWFVRPSAWGAIPAARQSLILEAIGEVEYSIGAFPPFSILDAARLKLLAFVREHIGETDDPAAAQHSLAVEEAKLIG